MESAPTAGSFVETKRELLPLIVSVIPAVGLFLFDTIHMSPNRVAEATGYGLRASIYPWWPIGAIAGSAVMVLLYGGRKDSKWSVYLWAGTISVMPWILVHQGATALTQTVDFTELSRFNPGGGVWFSMIAALAAWHEALRGTTGRARLLSLTLLVGGIAGIAYILMLPPLDRLSYFVEYRVRSERFLEELLQHVRLSGSAVGIATLIGVPAGILAFRRPSLRDWILDATNTIQTIPSLAMFGLLIAPLAAISRAVPALRSMGISGVGTTPALIALTLYALLPIVRNTVTGLSVVPGSVRESGEAMGMTRRQRFWIVEIPLALPVVIRGVRTAAVQAVGNTTVAGLIGAGGLGWFIFQGLGQAATDLVVLGVLPIVLLAIFVDRLFLALQIVTDRG